MPSTLTQRRSGGTAASKNTGNNSAPRKSSTQNSMMPARSSLSSIDKMTQPNEAGSVFKIIIWGVVILATGIGLAVIVRNLTKQNTDEADTTQETTEEETTAEETTTEEDATETEEIDTTDEDAEEEDTTDDTADETTDTTEETTATGEYSKSDQTINEGLTTNTVSTIGYSYSTTAINFEYDIKLSNAATYPKVTATLDETEKTLTVVVYNLATDSIVGNGGSGTTEFASPRNVQSVDISNASNKTTFVFEMNTATQYKLVKTTNDAGVTVVRVDIKNS
ncbi:hypothetical protein JW978_03325 [Candidatus Dojkabacteria bacterium]|nr:hypothetical protein [Candidatus Dojkabacteria bacterium]